MKIFIINGPNLNMLNYRENIYGNITYEKLCEKITKKYKFSIDIVQSNYEGKIIEYIHYALNKYDAIIINPAAYTHYSYAISDALKIFTGIKVEVHLTNIEEREDFRKVSVIRDDCEACFMGKGAFSYIEAIDYVKERLDNTNENI